MNTPQSNAKQRRHALLRAIALVVIVMLFTGFGVSLAPLAKYQEQFGSDEDCKNKAGELAQIKKQRGEILALMGKMEAVYAIIVDLDRQYEKMTTPNAGSSLMREIKPLEEELSNLTTKLKGLENDSLAIHAAQVYSNLLIAREMIWQMRRNTWPETPPEDCGEQLAEIRIKMQLLADDLEDKAEDVQTASDEIKRFLGKKNPSIQKKLNQYTKDLKDLAQRQRMIN